MTPYFETIDFLKYKGIESFGKTLKINQIDKNKDCIVFNITSGFGVYTEEKLQYLGLQILTYTTQNTEGYYIQNWIQNALEKATQDEIINNTTTVSGWKTTSTIGYVGQDEETGRHIYSNNYIIYYNE